MSLKAYAWTTVDRAADFADLTLSSAEETVMENIINSTTEYLEKYIGRRIKKTSYSNEYYDGSGAGYIFLKNFPVDSGSSVTLQVRTSAVNEDDWDTVDSDNYHVKYDAGYLEAISGYNFLQGPRRYRVSYTAGFDFDNSSTYLADTEAGDLEFVAWQLASAAWSRRRGGGAGGIQSESIGDYRVTYAKTVFESDEIKAVLDKYRRVEVGGYPTPSHG